MCCCCCSYRCCCCCPILPVACSLVSRYQHKRQPGKIAKIYYTAINYTLLTSLLNKIILVPLILSIATWFALWLPSTFRWNQPRLGDSSVRYISVLCWSMNCTGQSVLLQKSKAELRQRTSSVPELIPSLHTGKGIGYYIVWCCVCVRVCVCVCVCLCVCVCWMGCGGGGGGWYSSFHRFVLRTCFTCFIYLQ